jgi:hypothetical protein
MKVYISILVISLITFCSCRKDSQLAEPVSLKNGLIAFYPFSGNANDLSGNENHGLKNQVIESPDRIGNSNSSYLFNGIDSYIEMPKLSSVEIGANSFSISLWINVLHFNTVLPLNSYWSRRFLTKGGNGFIIGTFDNGSSGLPNSGKNYGIGWDTYGKDYGIYPDILPLNGWNHIVCVRTFSGYDYYVNNKKYSLPFNFSNIPESDLNFPLILGKGIFPFERFFHGYLDDIRIYNRALTQEEITYLANN